ncbi:class I SAM-dependent methyltransferase [Dickeya chrysanthemi]|uniref:class I SAM-dependent methyltransferase n=1 Tax=Dickeya chrysanthemi TaxID=556 RepID=UPI0025A2F5F1|nr:class I SAM-dependent methyltransferase [Dickeya chrysanthemi]WJM84520.1 class I SAM-dependent methyltransferase [Dickeya chrysanthemi]
MFVDESIYKFKADIEVFARTEYQSIPYSDGDAQEELLLEIISSSRDLSVLSQELKAKCTDWVTTYHLSSLRSNLLRPIDKLFIPGGKILEIGAGCGAITRFLGESGADVLALEGSLRRAKIARARTKDLTNVSVVSERFDKFVSTTKFDVITLIGVLEYSNLFSEGIDSALSMLEKVKNFLAEDGVLIIAIENQLGLKYFAGASEDHLGQAMYGIEGRYTKQQAQTYGHHVLSEKLVKVGLSSIKTLLPFPDYKLPVSIVTELGAYSDNFDASVFATQSVRADMQLPDELNFIPELVWPEVFKNKLSVALSNSFLIIASNKEKEVCDRGLLAIHYGSERCQAFKKVTTFSQIDGSQDVIVKRNLLSSNCIHQDNDLIGFRLDGYEKYIRGFNLSTEFTKVVTTPGWSMEYVIGYFEYYLECLSVSLNAEGFSYENMTQETPLPPVYLDAIPTNFIIDEEGHPRFFEREWLAKDNLTVGHLVFRAVIYLIGKISSFAISDTGRPITRGEFVKGLFIGLGFASNKNIFDEYMKLESALSRYSTGILISENGIDNWYPDHLLPGYEKLHELEKKEESASKSIFEYKSMMSKAIDSDNDNKKKNIELMHVLSEKEKYITSLEDELTLYKKKFFSRILGFFRGLK